MSQDLAEQIARLWKNKWVDLHGLVTCATLHLSPSESPSIDCVSISLLGQGSFNIVYILAFSDNTEVAASVCRYDESMFNPEAKRSEIATMKFVRESGLYPDVPVPKVLACDLTFTNAARAPYVLMEVVPGVTTKLTKGISGDLDAASLARDFALVKSLAKLQASLSKPVPFNQIGNLVTDVDGKFVLGPLMTMSQHSLGGPFRSIQELWRSQLEDELLRASTEWGNLEMDDSAITWSQRCLGAYKSIEDLWRAQPEKQLLHALEEFCTLETDLLDPVDPRCTSQIFSELFQLLSSLISHFQPPKSYMPLVLHHPDIALRNILFDESSISSGDWKMTGLIDWGGAQILPLMLTAKYPDDLRTAGEYTFVKPGWNDHEDWYTVPCDWTSTGDPSQWPKAYGLGRELIDRGPSVYLRAYFSVCYAEQLHAQHGDANLSRATLFRDATYYMKFHEVVCGGWFMWAVHKTWIRETYWRLRMTGHGRKDQEELIIGPNLYRESIEKSVRNVSLAGESVESELDPVTLEYVPVACHK